MSASFDNSEILKLAADLGDAGRGAIPFATKAVAVTANRVKQSWRGKVAGSPGLGGLAGALSYDVTAHVADVAAEIGYDKAKSQGPLGNVSEFGTSRHAPRGYGAAALQENEGDFQTGLEKALDDAMRAQNL